jgi:hypothetical protein
MLLVLVLEMLLVLMLQTADSGDRDADAKNAAEVVTTTVFTHTIVKSSVKLGAAYVDDAADGTNAVDSTDGVQMLCRDTSVGTALDASRLPISITISKVVVACSLP